MKREHVLISLFFLVSAAFFYLFYQVIIPFFVPICWAGVFVILFYPLYERLLPHVKRKGIASLIMCVLVLLLIIGPVGYLLVALVSEATTAVAYVNEMYQEGELTELFSFNLPWLEGVREELGKYYDLSKINIEEITKDAMNVVSSVLVAQTRNILANGAQAAFYFVLMFFTMYYFFKDGSQIIHRLRRLMPLTPTQINITFGQLHDIITATMYGGLVVALVQGVLGGILFWAVGIPSAVFWGALMAFLSIIPLIGAFIIYVPAGIILIIAGSWVEGLIVIIFGSVVISQIDNLLRPMLIAGKTSMHPLLLFFSIMGGIAVFGLLGVVLGPIIAAIFVTLLKIFELKLHPDPAAPVPETEEV
ncbi:AI-2E family transporter [candidate division GN15 bacterium]|nr:AI-2E family transporter [candidate division GN15 bacterium]